MRHAALLSGLAQNPALPADLLATLVTTAEGELCVDLAARSDLTRDQRRTLAARGGHPTASLLIGEGRLNAADVDVGDLDLDRHGVWIAVALLDRGMAPTGWAPRLAADHDPRVRAAVAEAAGIPTEEVGAVLADLAADPVPEVAAAAASSPLLPPALAAQLVRHPDPEVRQAVASNEVTPEPVLALLADLADHEADGAAVAQNLVANPFTPPAVAARFVAHPSLSVRWALAARPDLPAEVYRRLADDPIPGVRDTLARNPGIDEELIRRLAGDDGYDVRRSLAHHPAVPLDVLATLCVHARIGATLLPRIAGATEDELRSLARSDIPQLRLAVAERPDLPTDIVDLLAADRDAKVLKSVVAIHPVPQERLHDILTRHRGRVAVAMAGNPTAGPELLQALVRLDPPVPKVFRVIARRADADPALLVRCVEEPTARRFAALHPRLPPEIVEELLRDPDEEVAAAAAANPALPGAAMAAVLAADPAADLAADRGTTHPLEG